MATTTHEKFNENVVATWNLIYDDSGVVEVRAILKQPERNKSWEGWGDIVSGYFDNQQAFTEAVAALDREKVVKGIYVTLNPVIPALMGRAHNRLIAPGKRSPTTSDDDIVARRLLLIDADPFRPAETASTISEMTAAIEKRDEVAEWLYSQGFPPFYKADSGNGGHLLGRIELPNDEESKQLVNDFLECLNWKFGTTPADSSEAKRQFAQGIINVGIDTTVFNASRITKLYGTTVRKGDSTTDRPHRRAQLTFVPEHAEVIPAEMLERIAQEYRDHKADKSRVQPVKPRQFSTNGSAHKATGGDWWQAAEAFEQWCSEHGINLRQRESYTSDGYQYKYQVDCLTSNEHKDGAAIFFGANKGIGYKCHHNGCKLMSWADVRAMVSPKTIYSNGAQATKPEPQSGGRVDGWLSTLAGLGHDLKLNRLEDTIEIDGDPLDDIKRSNLVLRLYERGIVKSYVDDLLNVAASHQAYHPIQQYLNSLQWDGENHLSKLLNCIRGDDSTVTYSNGEKAPLHWLLIRRWLLGCAARGLDGDKQTAFKHQTPMLVVIGKQGLGKSSLIRWLLSGVGYEFHREGPINPHSIEDQRSMVNKWIWEVSELGSSLRKSDRDALKGFITQEWHTYRKPWGKVNITKPTLCNLVGTINPETGFLDDPTGHRRFLPVRLTQIDRGYSDIDVNQLWAQLVHMYRAGESPELSPLERQAIAETYKEHEVENPLQTYLQMYFHIEPGNHDLKCHTARILQRLQTMGIAVSNNNKAGGREINDALAPMGLERRSISIDGVKGWGWVGIEPNDIVEPNPLR